MSIFITRTSTLLVDETPSTFTTLDDFTLCPCRNFLILSTDLLFGLVDSVVPARLIQTHLTLVAGHVVQFVAFISDLDLLMLETTLTEIRLIVILQERISLATFDDTGAQSDETVMETIE